MRLKVNHFIFKWYYRRVPEFFCQWTLLKSIDLLIQNYKHQESLLESERHICGLYKKEADVLRAQVQGIRISLVASKLPKASVEKIAKMFAIDLGDN